MTSSTIESTQSTGMERPGADIAIWNPCVAAVWSFLLTPALGPYLHMRNWERLGCKDQAKQARTWFVMVVALHLLSFAVLSAASAMDVDLELPSGSWQGVFGVWYLFHGHVQVKYVATTCGANYVRRSWTAPLLTTFVIVAGLLAMSILLLATVSP